MVPTKDFIIGLLEDSIQLAPVSVSGAEIAQLAFFPRSGDKTLSKVWYRDYSIIYIKGEQIMADALELHEGEAVEKEFKSDYWEKTLCFYSQ